MVKTFFLIKLGRWLCMFGLSQDNGYSSQHPRWIVGQIGADKPPAYPLRPVADRGRGVACPHLRYGYLSLVFLTEKSLRTCRPAPRQVLQVTRY